MRDRWLGRTAVGVALILFATPARAENLAEAWSIAIRVNQGLRARELEVNAAGQDVEVARKARLPTVYNSTYNITLTNSPTTKPTLAGSSAAANASSSSSGAGSGSGSGSATTSSVFGGGTYIALLGRNQNDLPLSFTEATLPLYTGGRLKKNIEAAGHQLQSQRTEQSRTALDLRLTVAEAYVGILRARKNLETTRSNVEQLGSFSRDTRNRRAEGLAIRSDELAADVSLSNAQLNEIQAQTNLATAWATYNRYLCRRLDSVVDLDELANPPTEADWTELARRAIKANADFSRMSTGEVSDLTARALNIRPELAGLTAQARALDAQGEAARANLRPQVQLTGGMAFVGAQNAAPQGNGNLLVSMNWNLTDSGATRRRTEAFKQRERATLARRADQAADIALQVQTRWLDLRQARLRVPVARVAVAQSDENNKVIQDRYRQQLATYTEVLDAETRRVTSLNNYYNALYDESLAFYRLRRSIGDI